MKSSWKGFYVEEGIELCSQHNSSLQLNSTQIFVISNGNCHYRDLGALGTYVRNWILSWGFVNVSSVGF